MRTRLLFNVITVWSLFSQRSRASTPDIVGIDELKRKLNRDFKLYSDWFIAFPTQCDNLYRDCNMRIDIICNRHKAVIPPSQIESVRVDAKRTLEQRYLEACGKSPQAIKLRAISRLTSEIKQLLESPTLSVEDELARIHLESVREDVETQVGTELAKARETIEGRFRGFETELQKKIQLGSADDILALCKKGEEYLLRSVVRSTCNAALESVGIFDSSQFRHIAVIPDIHGDAEALLESLWIIFSEVESKSPIVPKQHFFSTVLEIARQVNLKEDVTIPKVQEPLSRMRDRVAVVQLGNVMGKGPYPYLCFQILASIEASIGWKVIRLIGNQDLPSFDSKSGGLDLTNLSTGADMTHDDAKLLFGTDGPLRKFITSQNLIVARIGSPQTRSVKNYQISADSGDTLFVHAGIDLRWAIEYLLQAGRSRYGWTDFISLVNVGRKRAFSVDPIGQSWFFTTPNTPLTTDRLARTYHVSNGVSYDDHGRGTNALGIGDVDNRSNFCKEIDTILTNLRVSRIIVGHTPDIFTHIPRMLCRERFMIIDVAMSRSVSADLAPHPFAMMLSLDTKSIDIKFTYSTL